MKKETLKEIYEESENHIKRETHRGKKNGKKDTHKERNT